MKKVYTAAERKEQLLDIGAKLGAKLGVVNVQRKQIAIKAGCAHSLVSVYLGDQSKLQRAVKARMKKQGLTEPSKEKIDAIGVAARKHKKDDKRDTRKRSGKEVEAIKRKKSVRAAATRVAAARTVSAPETKPTKPEYKPLRAPAERKPVRPSSTPAQAPSERKTAASAPGELEYIPQPPLAGAFP